MINTPTVFVLGAGASYNFGYPLGKNLMELILQNFDSNNPKNSIKLFEGLGFSIEEILSFQSQLKHSAAPSIDSFLEPRKEEERYLGKLAIANALIPFEDTDNLFSNNSWYKELLNKIQPIFNDFERNKISFITFNYDRSLEHFLMTSLKNWFKKSDQEVADKLKKISIVHLYGKLANLPWESVSPEEYSRGYNPAITPYILRKSSLGLKIIYDNVAADNPEFKKARQLLRAAKKIYFLGFGYHKDNLNRLRIKSLVNTDIPPASTITIEGTSFMLPKDTTDSIYREYRIKFPDSSWNINDMLEKRIKLR